MKSSLTRQARLTLQSPTPRPFICTQCLSLTTSLGRQFSTTLRTPASSSGGKPDFTTRLRRRIWGTDSPPGQKDPYKKMTPEELAAEEEERRLIEGAGEGGSAADAEGEISRARSAGEYVPAERGDKLERMGGAKGWWERDFDRENVYEGFLTRGVVGVEERGDIVGLLRRVAVEILALRQAGVSLTSGAQAEWLSEEFMEEIDIIRGQDGSFELREQAPDLVDELVETLTRVEEPVEEGEEAESRAAEEGIDEEEQRILSELHAEEDAAAAEIEAAEAAASGETASEATEIETVATTKVHDTEFLELPLSDLDFKFALAKRLTYLLGTRIPDPRLAQFQQLSDIVGYLSEKPAPKKLAQILQAMPEYQALANVEIFERKRSFVHKEMEIGRWKVIESELRRRGLPVRRSERVYR